MAELVSVAASAVVTVSTEATVPVAVETVSLDAGAVRLLLRLGLVVGLRAGVGVVDEHLKEIR